MDKYWILLFMLMLPPSVNALRKQGTLLTKQTAVYFLKYYYEEQPEKILYTVATARRVDSSNAFCLLNFNPLDLSEITYQSCFNAAAVPTNFGDTKIEENRMTLNFRGRDTTILIRGSVLKNITNLWFWKVKPKLNEIVIVNTVKKNFITNSVDQVAISYTYLGKNKIKIMGKMRSYHLVKSRSLSGANDIYDERWYDHKGMLVKEKHVVGKDGNRVAELSKIVIK